jgi:methylmalonyl-CoA/ethylmalonyl-CoA epimerase
MPFKDLRMKFHHIGIACEKIDKVKEWVMKVYSVTHEGELIFDPLQNATLCLMSTEEGLTFELISGEKVKGLIKKGVNLYHTCYSVPDIDKAAEEFKNLGAMLFSSPQEAVLFNNKKVAFFYTPMGIIELLEE